MIKDKKFILHPGNVINFETGDSKPIDAATLAHLYNVDLNDCVLLNTKGKTPGWGRPRPDFTGLIHLYPKFDGNYKIRE